MNKTALLLICSILIYSCGKKENKNEEPAVETPVMTDTVKKQEAKTEKLPEETTRKKTHPELKPEKIISPLEAKNYVGRVVTVKGFVADVYQSNKVAYLNFVEQFPRNPFTAVIFPDNFAEFGDLNKYMGKDVAVTGLVTTYKGKPQIILDNTSQVKVLE